MSFSTQLKKAISSLNLLNHPFYQAWMRGDLSLETLKEYAVQYYPHVEAFPRYVSAVHSFCEDKKSRAQLLENLMEEEGVSGKDHPHLWRQFGGGLGVDESEFSHVQIKEKAKELVDIYWAKCRSSYAEGLAALFAYEYQVPEIATAKIQGLKEKYQIEDKDTLAFFSTHEFADKFHSEACAQMLDALPLSEQPAALSAAVDASKALWAFLTEVHAQQA